VTDPIRSSKITPAHLERWAFIFIRQSDPQQVVKHPEIDGPPVRPRQSRLALGLAP